jgi:hypothetical protein
MASFFIETALDVIIVKDSSSKFSVGYSPTFETRVREFKAEF